MRTFVDILTSRWFLTLVGAIIVSALIWFFGPLIGIGENRPLESEFSRLLGILIVTFIWGASNLIAQARARRRNSQMVEALAKPQGGPADAELQRLGDKFEKALQRLRGRKFGRRRSGAWLYQLPWYLMIGPPGSGKTTALLQSGLRFPVAEDSRDRELRGVGGTRDCDWFFTDEAVLIDTAGRYTTQESDEKADQAAWLGFLDLLKKYRRRQPINGVIVALSCTDLLRADETTLAAHARAIRARLAELEGRLDITLPVYLLFTKSDLVAGFNEHFADLGDHEREQVWGVTLPLDPKTGASETAGLTNDLDALLERLDQRQLERLQNERNLERRAAIFNFPAEFAALRPQVLKLVEQVSYQSGYEGTAKIRGVYFTSGTQEGTPIDRLMQSIAGNYGISAPPPLTQQGNRSFFLTRLLREVIFNEASLVRYNPRTARRERLGRGLGWGAAALVIVVGTGLWGWSYFGNRDRLTNVASEFVAYAEGVQPYAKRQLGSADIDLSPVVPHLNRLSFVASANSEDMREPVRMGLGLSQKRTLARASDIAYRGALEDVFLPRLILRLEEQLRGNINQPEFVLEALRAYLMLGGQAPLDPDHVAAFLDVVDWQNNYPGEPQLREDLLIHLGNTLDVLPTIDKPQLDLDLIAEARRTIQTIPLAKRAYVAFLESDDVRSLPEWQPLDHAGPQASLVLTRRSGRPLNAGIPGIFTYDAFHSILLPNLPDIAAAEAFESWLIGSSDDEAIQEIQLGALQEDILRLYYDDYIEQWERLIGDVTLQPLGDLQQSVQALKVIAGPSSPIKLLLQNALVETRLSVPPPEPEVEEDGGGGVPKGATRLVGKAASKLLGSKVGGNVKKIARIAKRRKGGSGTAPGEIETEPPGLPVEQHFQQLALLVEGADGAPAALDQAIGALDVLRGELQTISLSPNPDQALLERGGLANVAQPVAQAAGGLPEPLSGMVSGIADKFASQGQDAVRRRLNAIWQTEVLPFCRQATSGRFPFTPTSQVDISLADFARLLGPNGLVDNYTNTHLAPLVDMAGPGWRWQRDVGIGNGALQPFERARRIRDSLFVGGATPQSSFTLKPINLDGLSARAIVELDGQLADYAHGPVQPTRMQWPGPNGTNLASVTFIPVGRAANQRSIRKEGAWSWFRLLQSGNFQRTERPDLFRVVLGLEPNWIEFEIVANSVSNPFDIQMLSQFRCPNGL